MPESSARIESVDVIIPVHDAPEHTRRCIESAREHLRGSVRRIRVEDDASGPETRALLDALAGDGVEVHHAPHNRGFGATVNQAVEATDAALALVLNSDVELSQDVLPPLRRALAAAPDLAALNPAGDVFEARDFSCYRREPGGWVRAHHLLGFAFLIRRSVFLRVGGFDPAYGRGYYEDTDLSRRLVASGARIGVHPEAQLRHAGGGSFAAIPETRALARRNRARYYARYAAASRNVLLVSSTGRGDAFPAALDAAIEDVGAGGGFVHWLTPAPASGIPCLEVVPHPARVRTALRLARRGRRRRHRRATDLWLLPGAPRRLVLWLIPWARARGLSIRRFEETPS